MNRVGNSAQRFPMGRVGNSAQRFPMGRVGNSAQRFPMGRVGNSAQRFPMGRVGNSAQRFPMGRVVGWELSFTENLSYNSHRFNIEIQILVGLVMAIPGVGFPLFKKTKNREQFPNEFE
ncbi:hypothetical protein [Leptospira noguchii]|uniref:hypothetical protein n=1 Tax=Leptospira noguchii TaxID=28182 RepID=UPI00030BE37A|nr:hypothetical protein [Leptospira noguchii]